MAHTTTLSSAGASAALFLNPLRKTTTMQLTVTAASSGIITVQSTLDDPSIPGGPTVTWAALSSAIQSSGIDGTGLAITALSPIAGLRLSTITASSSGGTGTAGTATLKAIQSVTG